MKYYKEGILVAQEAATSKIGLDEKRRPVKILGRNPINNKFYVKRSGSLKEENVTPVKFFIEGKELHPNSYSQLLDVEPFEPVMFRVRGKYCSLFNQNKSRHYNKSIRNISINGYFNNDLPSNFNLLLGYDEENWSKNLKRSSRSSDVAIALPKTFTTLNVGL